MDQKPTGGEEGENPPKGEGWVVGHPPFGGASPADYSFYILGGTITIFQPHAQRTGPFCYLNCELNEECDGIQGDANHTTATTL